MAETGIAEEPHGLDAAGGDGERAPGPAGAARHPAPEGGEDEAAEAGDAAVAEDGERVDDAEDARLDGADLASVKTSESAGAWRPKSVMATTMTTASTRLSPLHIVSSTRPTRRLLIGGVPPRCAVR